MEKVLQKIGFLLYFFAVIKNVFHFKLALAANCVTFHGFLSLLLANNTLQAFSGAKDSSPSRLVKTMFKWIFLSLIFTPYCKYNCCKNSVKFLHITFSGLLQKLLKL